MTRSDDQDDDDVLGPEAPQEPIRFVSIETVIDRTDLSKATIYRWVKDGFFPAPMKLNRSKTRWVEHEIDEWMQACMETCR